MEKIMRALLQAKYPSIDADVLLEIASMTPNSTVAVEKLCGLHEPHTEDSLGKYRIGKTPGRPVYTLVSINEWTDEVSYQYEYEETKGFYVSKSIDTSMLTIDNIAPYKVSSNSDDAKWVEVKTGEIKCRTAFMSIASWLDLMEGNDLP